MITSRGAPFILRCCQAVPRCTTLSTVLNVQLSKLNLLLCRQQIFATVNVSAMSDEYDCGRARRKQAPTPVLTVRPVDTRVVSRSVSRGVVITARCLGHRIPPPPRIDMISKHKASIPHASTFAVAFAARTMPQSYYEMVLTSSRLCSIVRICTIANPKISSALPFIIISFH